MVAYSHRFSHTSAMPPNPGAFSGLYVELEKRYLTSEPMAAGMACVFDTRVLHATDENLTSENRVAAVLSLVPAAAMPRLHFWNADSPKRLEVYHIDTEFAWNMTPNTYPDEKAREGAKFVEMIDYDPAPWTLAELRERIPLAPGADATSWLRRILSFGSPK
jgi:ectoine hydroxylase-related dioxygenase (phytanoyl-CoA dioxygenase family)